MSDIKRVVIAIPVHNALSHVQSVLADVERTAPECPLVVVDDASGPETALWLDSYAQGRLEDRDRRAGFGFRRNARQQLFTRSMNLGIRTAVEEYNPDAVLCLNTDCRLQEGWLAALIEGMNRDPRIGIVGYPEELDGKRPHYREVYAPEYVTGHCWLARVSMCAEIGVLCETDTDGRQDPALAAFKGQAHIGSERLLGYRANASGWRTLNCHLPLCQHGGGPSWERSLAWLNRFSLQPLWAPSDGLGPVRWYDED